MDWLERQNALLGEEASNKLKNKCVMVFGIGGVGGHAIETLVRCGVGHIIAVDFDTVSVTNKNRQIIALESNIGMKKTEVMKKRAVDINPQINFETVDTYVTKENAGEIISKFSPDYIIDAIDNVSAKLAIASYAYNNGIKIVSSMGTGNKLDPMRFVITDINKTSVCPLARVMRHELKKLGVEKLDVLYSDETPCKTELKTPASVAFVPSVAGILLARYAVLRMTQE